MYSSTVHLSLPSMQMLGEFHSNLKRTHKQTCLKEERKTKIMWEREAEKVEMKRRRRLFIYASLGKEKQRKINTRKELKMQHRITKRCYPVHRFGFLSDAGSNFIFRSINLISFEMMQRWNRNILLMQSTTRGCYTTWEWRGK